MASHDAEPFGWDKLFHQSGYSLIEVSPVAAKHISDHLAILDLTPGFKSVCFTSKYHMTLV